MDKHPHAEALDRITMSKVRAHFNISRQAVHQWRKSGVPRIHRNSVRMLALVNGVSARELDE